jgi:hypothetical protein
MEYFFVDQLTQVFVPSWFAKREWATSAQKLSLLLFGATHTRAL